MILGMSKRVVFIVGALVLVVIVYLVNANKQADASSTGCKVTVTADVLNARATPDGNGQVVGKYLRGASFDAQKVVQNGFRQVGKDKWVSAQFAQPTPGSQC